MQMRLDSRAFAALYAEKRFRKWGLVGVGACRVGCGGMFCYHDFSRQMRIVCRRLAVIASYHLITG